LWEYVATGKPFVSVDLPAMEPAKGFVDVARDRNHFLELVEQRLKSGTTVSTQGGAVLAKGHSWDAIFQQMLERLESKLSLETAPGEAYAA
jgi:hypothetical protein